MKKVGNYKGFDIYESPLCPPDTIYLVNNAVLKPNKRKWKHILGWTSWYCPVKGCNVIIYNNLDERRYRIGAHKRSHKKI